MRQLISFSCEGDSLGATLDSAEGSTGVIIVTGGTQTRIGSHRMFERLARALAAEGYPCFRFDRRGVGDSEGEDPDFRGSGPDLAAAVAAFRGQCPALERVVGFGLCDGATALALFGAESGVDHIVLANPWLVEAEAGAPPPAAIKRHYRDQLLSLAGWKKLLGGAVSYKKLLTGLIKVAASAPAGLAGEVAAALRSRPLPVELLLARRDNTAIAAEDVWKSAQFEEVRSRGAPVKYVESDSHTFARPGDMEALLEAVLSALRA
jgi:exosortase A-associated hydrolase 1